MVLFQVQPIGGWVLKRTQTGIPEIIFQIPTSCILGPGDSLTVQIHPTHTQVLGIAQQKWPSDPLTPVMISQDMFCVMIGDIWTLLDCVKKGFQIGLVCKQRIDMNDFHRLHMKPIRTPLYAHKTVLNLFYCLHAELTQILFNCLTKKPIRILYTQNWSRSFLRFAHKTDWDPFCGLLINTYLDPFCCSLKLFWIHLTVYTRNWSRFFLPLLGLCLF